MTDLGVRLGMVREFFGISAEAMSNKLGKRSRGSWEGYEKNSTLPKADVLAHLAKDGINTHWLLTGEGEMLRDQREGTSEESAREAENPEPTTDQEWLASFVPPLVGPKGVVLKPEDIPPKRPAARRKEAGDNIRSHARSRPIIGLAACGPNGWATWEQNRFRAVVPSDLGEDSDAFPVIAHGDSMRPFGIIPGALCWASPSETPETFDIVCAERRSPDGTTLMSIKCLGMLGSGAVELWGYEPLVERPTGGETQRTYFEIIPNSEIVRMSVITHILTRPTIGR